MIYHTNGTYALKKLKKGRFPYQWDLNIYRGCTHNCIYCYARGYHQYLEHKSFGRDLYIKDNLLSLLDEDLHKIKGTGEIVNIGGLTDSYQPIEKREKLMPEVLKLFLKYEVPCIISTKSNLILRDFDLLKSLSEKTYVNVAVSVSTFDDQVSSILEPGAKSVARRFEVIKAFEKTQCSKGIHHMPIVPYVTDSDHDLQSIIHFTKRSGADYYMPGTLYRKEPFKDYLMEHIRRDLPKHYADLKKYFEVKEVRDSYKKELRGRIGKLVKQYDVSMDYQGMINKRLNRGIDGSKV